MKRVGGVGVQSNAENPLWSASTIASQVQPSDILDPKPPEQRSPPADREHLPPNVPTGAPLAGRPG
ncbi:MAG: hypothetical protein GDA48_15175 [Hormoscilla sp. GM102CHS1]|nr:hypothetical protein [Hormoscilla sp. GM102CHS1]